MKVQVHVYLEAEVVHGNKGKGGISVVPKGMGRWKADSRKGGICQRCVTEVTNYLNSSKTLPVKSPDSPCPGKPCVQDTLEKLLILSSSCLEFSGEH